MQFEHEVLRSFELPIRQRAPSVPRGLRRSLRQLRPTIVLAAGFSPLVAAPAARFANATGAAFGLWSGEIAAMGTAQNPLRLRQRRRLLENTDFAIAYGSLAAAYLRKLAPSLPVVLGRNTSVVQGASATSTPQRDLVKFLTVGDLASSRKGVDVLIDALASATDVKCRLDVIGDGDQRSALQARAGDDTRIRFLGGMPAERVRSRYHQAEGFLFPSRSDVFGLALPEAMAAGLATVTSDAPGAVADLALHERNCIVLSSHEPGAWATAIRRLATDKELRATLGAAAQETIARSWTIDHAVEGMTAGLRLGALRVVEAP